ncbi:PIN domain-like protein [Lojkania enalia]|uniref:PIN domain-like protein n=1 Tax=Lojkania enalia TaxID=147567 RepID=A0A9P4NCQ4_9PLEO|nr:PIN domain-like protein [Didymosphaeria enalia]
MGVTGLWTVLQPCARPIRIETLNKKRLAVDASIWIYQFLKAVRDKEGNALRNSHIVGFFRRICKLLFVGIKPVFVFDGGAPALKRQTISSRKSRREGRREDAVRTAGKLLALQMQRLAEDEERKRKESVRHPREEPEEEIPENVVYVDELLQTQQERQKNRQFKKKDQYHLPDLETSLAEMGGQNDPRIMSLEELEEYARQFDRGEDINVYDFSKIDFDSPFFVSLPASDRYNILNAARLRSRLRMGYSKDQLDNMFPDRMAFSKFQIERVRERNELTQRLMNINGMADDAMFGANMANRVAGEKGREYVLVKNDGVEGGWALGVVTSKEEGQASKPIDVDKVPLPDVEADEWEDDEDEFEDVPIEGLNRLPKSKPALNFQDREGRDFVSKELAKHRQRFYESRKEKSTRLRPHKPKAMKYDPDSLFLAEEGDIDNWRDEQIEEDNGMFEELTEEDVNEEEQQLRQAIALSLQQGLKEPTEEQEEEDEEEDIYREVFHQERSKEVNPFSSAKGSGLAIARMANHRSSKLAPQGPFNENDSEDDDMDLQAALAESRKSKRQARQSRPTPMSPPVQAQPPPKPASKSTNASGFDGPLPFEKLNLGNSILGRKKMQKIEEDNAGGFERELELEQKKSAEPLPPWFSGDRDIKEDLSAQRQEEKQEWERSRKADESHFKFQELPRLRKQGTREIIDLEGPSTQDELKEIVIIDSRNGNDTEMEDIIEGEKLQMGDLVDKVRANPPQLLSDSQGSPLQQKRPGSTMTGILKANKPGNEQIDWSESEPEPERSTRADPKTAPASASQSLSPEFEDVSLQIHPTSAPMTAKSPSLEFEDVPIQTNPPVRHVRGISAGSLEGGEDLEIPIIPPTNVGSDNAALDVPDDESDQYSDPEDAELFASLAAEAEEHARFAQELNNNMTTRINFDEELKQLRAQQKKDRRDADEVTQTMISECQHLLTLFGLPYITAPMEAEAQCAELVELGLVDGIVTDDSDTFLFGGTRVYKNMFNAAKFVECYLANDLTSEFSLTREKLIEIAQLLGSDYTPGIPGIGPVTALEILSEFQSLQVFKDWWMGVQNGTVSKEEDKLSQFRRRFRRTQNTKLFLPTNFPDARVAEAYLHPDVDDDPHPFQWGVPDLDALRNFLSSQIGWSRERTDEVLVPVIRDMNRREKEGTQANITRFFEGSVGAGAFAPRIRDQGGPNGAKKGKAAAGKRLGAALTRLAERDRTAGGDDAIEVDDQSVEVVQDEDSTATASRPAKGASKRKKRSAMKTAPSATSDFDAEEDKDDELYSEPRKKIRKPRKAKANA